MKARKGAIPTNVRTLMKAASMTAFTDELAKLAVDDHEVVQAVEKLQKPRPWKTIGQTAGLVATVGPAIDGLGKFTKGFVNTRGGLGARAVGGVKEVKTLTPGDIASKAVTAGLGGGAIAAAKEGIELHRARRSLRNYIMSQDKLSALLGGAPSGPKISTPAAPTLGVLRGSSNKGQRVGNTPIAAKSGTTNSASGDAMNPRRNLGDAMRAFKT